MRTFIFIRILTAIFTLYAVTTLMFFMFRFVPGDPTTMFIQENLSEENIARQKALWGLDKPLWYQYVFYMKNLVTGDFGVSFLENRPVLTLISSKIWNTISLMAPATFVTVLLGGMFGAFIGWRRGSRIEKWTVVSNLILRSMPVYWMGIILLMIFSYKLGLTPSGEMRTPGTPETSFLQTYLCWDFLYHLLLPLATVILYNVGGPLLLMRSSMIEVKGEDFLEFLRAKGLRERNIVHRAARNAILPMVTYIAVWVGFLFEGQVLVETIFAWPGIGREIVRGILSFDYPIVQGAFFILALVVIVMNLLTDVLYGYLDPRIVY
jgi:peptide/nickel transport system permease protein